MAKISAEQKLSMWKQLILLQEEFPYTEQGLIDFAQVCINSLIPSKPNLNFTQADILAYMLGGPAYRMVQAQRGQAKTTLAGITAAFILIHNPHFRIVIFSQTGKRATEISNWIVKIFKRLDFLSFMLPDKSNGDKDNADAFDIHHVFKGADKSPSVSCYSIVAGAQGARADFIIADDIESLQNSRTAAGREWLEEQSKEFESINTHGDILYLGTPQSMDSIYNNLPSRGYGVRIWTGRYPTPEQIEAYGEYLAPSIRSAIEKDPSLQTGYGLDGRSGAPTCPEMFDDEILCTKEMSLGKSKFQLQQMLNTRLSDADRFPLKPSDLIVTHFGKDEGMILPVWNNSPQNRVETRLRVGNRPTDKFYNPITKDYKWGKFTRKIMYIDPAGGGKNGDETAYAIVFQLGNMLYLYEVGAIKGGYADEDGLRGIVRAARGAGVHEVYIEENYGKGAFMAIIRPLFQEDYPNCQLHDDYSEGNKEARIIDTLEPLIGSHRLVVNQKILDDEVESVKHYAPKDRPSYQLFTQLSLITYAKGCLKHDDRLEAVANACKLLVEDIDYSYSKKLKEAAHQESLDFIDMMTDPRRRKEYFGSEGRSRRHRNTFATPVRKAKRKW